MTITSGARWHARDSEADVDTHVFLRPPPSALERTMILEIMRELEPRAVARPGARALSLVAVARAPAIEPNVFLTPATENDPPPPWAQPRVPQAAATTKQRAAVRVVYRRSLLPWLLALMCFLLAFGTLHDPALRRKTRSQVQTAASDAYRYAQGALARGTSKL